MFSSGGRDKLAFEPLKRFVLKYLILLKCFFKYQSIHFLQNESKIVPNNFMSFNMFHLLALLYIRQTYSEYVDYN